MFQKKKKTKQAERSNAKAWGQEHAWTTRGPVWLEWEGSRASHRGPRGHNAVIPMTASCHWDPIKQEAEWKTYHQHEVILPPNQRNQTDKPAPRKMPPHHSTQSTKARWKPPHHLRHMLPSSSLELVRGLEDWIRERGGEGAPQDSRCLNLLYIYTYTCMTNSWFYFLGCTTQLVGS